MSTDAQKKAVIKYDAANTRQIHLKLNIKTDADILQRFEEKGNVQGYIKDLVRADIEFVRCKDCGYWYDYMCHASIIPSPRPDGNWYCAGGKKHNTEK